MGESGGKEREIQLLPVFLKAGVLRSACIYRYGENGRLQQAYGRMGYIFEFEGVV